ncbi:MAG: DUF2207 domain-containing protein, partial [Candidatus Acidiferrum sp.]
MSPRWQIRVVFLTLIFAVASLTAYANSTPTERILDFHSDITLQGDSSLQVTETITVYASGSKIQHGIFRDFPTRYKDPYNNNYVVGFQMQAATLDSFEEPFRVEAIGNGKRVYLGSPNTVVQKGKHTYTITYITTRQLGFYKEHDELFWNVTGNGWDFLIDHAWATVHLPSRIPVDQVTLAGFTGPQGSRETDLTSSREVASFEFAASRRLGRHEGLSVLLMWPKGYVTPPTPSEKMQFFFQDNAGVLVLAAGWVVIFLYYLIAWLAVGRDPVRGVIMPRYEPPPNLSPAAMRYLVHMGYDNKTFAAAILDMGARGYLTIKEQAGSYTLYSSGKDDRVLSPDEKQIASEIFDGRTALWMHQENHAIMQAAQQALKKWLKSDEQKVYFVSNSRYLIFPVLLSFTVAVVYLLKLGIPQVIMGAFLCFSLTFWTLGCAGLLLTVFKNWKAVFRGQKAPVGNIGSTIFLTLVCIPFVGFEVMALGFMAKLASISLVVFLVTVVLLHFLYAHLLKAPTIAGRQLLDQVEGFKLFLGKVDGDRLNRANPPEQTPETFEKFLPYALALDVEQDWAEKFSGALAMAGTARGDSNVAYTPSF